MEKWPEFIREHELEFVGIEPDDTPEIEDTIREMNETLKEILKELKLMNKNRKIRED